MIRTIIVEDEFHPRQTLQQKLAEFHTDVEVVAACETAEAALTEILRLRPDLLFLDIQLPDKNGLWLADQLNQLACETFIPPEIIFTTAYSDSEYLLTAIRLAAIDYLIKPIMLDNLSLAIVRFLKRTADTQGVQKLMNIVKAEKMLSFKNTGGLLLVKTEDIVYIEGDGNYIRMWFANGEMEDIFERLGEIEKKLPPTQFVRAGRNYIVNKQYLRQLHLRQSHIQLSTSFNTYTLKLSAQALKQLRDAL
jgi:two-component system LytT family response regulator